MATAIEFAILAKDHASKTVHDIGNEFDKTGSKMEKMHKVGRAAGVALAGGLALATKAAFEFTKNAAADQQSQALLARTLHATTGATKEQATAVESWITAQGKAKGFTDEELRPALSRLSVATGSVAKSQKLASLAMDISTGTGKSLKVVAEGLAKAQAGNVSSLARLGVRTTVTTKDTGALEKAQTGVKQATLSYTAAIKAHGKGSVEASIASDKLKQAHEAVGAAMEKTKRTTLGLDEITKNLTKQYGGAATKNASTAAGQQKILTVQTEELKEQLGLGLIPVMQKATAVGLAVVNWISNNTKTAGLLAAGLGTLLLVVASINLATRAFMATQAAWNTIMLLSGKAALGTRIQLVGLFIAEKTGAAVTKGMAAAQWLLNVAMDANPIGLVVIAVAALVVGMVIAYKHSATFRKIVQAAFHGVQAAASAVAGFFTHQIPAAFAKVKAAAGNALGWVKSNWPLILAILTGPIGLAVLAIAKNWSKIKAGASNLVSWFKGLPGKITGALGDLGTLLLSAGQDVIQGLIDGIQSKVSGLTDKLKSITHLIPIHKGPIDKDRVLLKPAGVAIMEGLIGAIDSKRVALQSVLDKVTAAVQASGAKLKAAISARNDFAGGFQSFSASAFGADYGSDEAGNPIAPTAASVIAFQKQQAAQAALVKKDVRRLVGMGLSPALIKQLQAQGAAGIPTIQALAAGSKSDIRQYNALNKQTSSDLQSAGMTAGNRLYGQQIAQDRKQHAETVRVLHSIERLLKEERAGGHEVSQLEIRGQTLVAFLKKVERTTGAKA